VLAGLIASHRLTGKKGLADHRFLFLGAGEAGTGIADLIAAAIVEETGGKCTLEEAKRKAFFVDSKGMICAERGPVHNLEHHKVPYAHSLKDLCGYEGTGKYDGEKKTTNLFYI
jgi:malate dehydrogenase (oxaloacetate-decarboxylating)(NADP+)